MLNRYRAATGRPTHRYLYGGNFTNISPLYVHHPLWRFLPRSVLHDWRKERTDHSPHPDRGSAPIISPRFPSSPGRTAITAAQGHRLSGPSARKCRTCGLHLPAIRNMDCRGWDGRLHLGGFGNISGNAIVFCERWEGRADGGDQGNGCKLSGFLVGVKEARPGVRKLWMATVYCTAVATQR